MTTFTKYEPGTFCWIDLMSPDAAASKRFYQDLFGWDIVDNPTDQGGVYTQFLLRGETVAHRGRSAHAIVDRPAAAVRVDTRVAAQGFGHGGLSGWFLGRCDGSRTIGRGTGRARAAAACSASKTMNSAPICRNRVARVDTRSKPGSCSAIKM